MVANTQMKKSPFKFIVFVYILSIPFWIIGALTKSTGALTRVNIPVSALMAVCPVIAALIFTFREEGSGGAKRLLARTFDYKRIDRKIWYAPILLLMPVVAILAYAVMRLADSPLPQHIYLPFKILPIFFVVFFVSATGEELGWSGYAISPMQDRLGALNASLVLGTAWAVWHIIPYFQSHHSIAWVAWQCLATVGLRVLIVWIFNNTSRSVFGTIVFHAMINVCDFMFPNYGSAYNPEIFAIIIGIIATAVTILWGPGTLARYRSLGECLGTR